MSQQTIYFDYAAATPLDPGALKAMAPYLSDRFYNPSATYGPALEVRKALEAARTKIAYWLGARGSEIVFTAGGTEANNLAIHGVMRQFPGANLVVSAIEHESVLAPAAGYDCRQVKVQPDGRVDLDDLRAKIDKDTVLVSLGYANNEIGVVQPIRKIAGIVADKRAGRSDLPLYFHSDACQAGNYLDLHASRLGVDMMTLNGGKVYGPKQSGALYVKAGTKLESVILGGGQERGLRSGTENVAGAVGLAVALERTQAMRRDETARLRKLQALFIDRLKTSVPGVVINGSLKHRLPNNIHITIAGRDNERLLIQLDEAGILAAAGSACSASNEEPSHVLRAIGLSDADARSSLRFTIGRDTSEADINQLLKTLDELVA